MACISLLDQLPDADIIIKARVANSLALDFIERGQGVINRNEISKIRGELLGYMDELESSNTHSYLVSYWLDSIGSLEMLMGDHLGAISTYRKALNNLKNLFKEINPNHYYLSLIKRNLAQAEEKIQ